MIYKFLFIKNSGKSSPVSGGRRPSLKDDQQQLENIILHNKISRRSSIDKLLDPQGIKVIFYLVIFFIGEWRVIFWNITKALNNYLGIL